MIEGKIYITFTQGIGSVKAEVVKATTEGEALYRVDPHRVNTTIVIEKKKFDKLLSQIIKDVVNYKEVNNE